MRPYRHRRQQLPRQGAQLPCEPAAPTRTGAATPRLFGDPYFDRVSSPTATSYQSPGPARLIARLIIARCSVGGKPIGEGLQRDLARIVEEGDALIVPGDVRNAAGCQWSRWRRSTYSREQTARCAYWISSTGVVS